MDPNNPNNTGNAQNPPTDQGGVPPKDPNVPSAQDLTPEALYGPSTPGVDLQATTPPTPPPTDMQSPSAPTADMSTPPRDPNLTGPVPEGSGVESTMDQSGQTTDNTMPTDLPPNDYADQNLAGSVQDNTLAGSLQDAPLNQGNFYQEAQIPQDTLPDPGMDQPQEPAPYEPYQQPQYDQPADQEPGLQPMAAEAPPETPETPASAAGLPPIPKRSKLPIIIVGVAVVLLISAVAAFFLLSRGGGDTRDVPTPTEEPLTCEEDPENPDCIETTEEPTSSGTSTPPPSASPTPGGTTRACELLGTCP